MMFGWARYTVIQTGAIAAIILFGMLSSPGEPGPPTAQVETAALGMAMIFVLLTYGGWNEAAYLTGELHDAPRNIVKVLALGTLILVVLYTLANVALLKILGLEGLRGSDAVAADMMRKVAGPPGEIIVTLAIVAAAVSTLNATIFTGARVFYAMGNDLKAMRWLGRWDGRGKAPVNGQLAQAALALALVGMGAATPDGFKAMVDYTAPVFWGFLLMVGLGLFVLRWRHPGQKTPLHLAGFFIACCLPITRNRYCLPVMPRPTARKACIDQHLLTFSDSAHRNFIPSVLLTAMIGLKTLSIAKSYSFSRII